MFSYPSTQVQVPRTLGLDRRAGIVIKEPSSFIGKVVLRLTSFLLTCNTKNGA